MLHRTESRQEQRQDLLVLLLVGQHASVEQADVLLEDGIALGKATWMSEPVTPSLPLYRLTSSNLRDSCLVCRDVSVAVNTHDLRS
jgi:hypothetical protein